MKFFTLWAVLFASALSVHSAAPETIFFNGKILTVNERFEVVNALAVDQGRIVATGDADKVRALAGPNTKLIDLQGRTVIPGLIDNHLHFLRDALRWKQQTRLDGVTQRAEALARITAKAKSLAPGQWVFVLGGWSEDQFADKPGGFTRDELDRAAPDNPVLVQKSYMSAYLNSRAEALLGETNSARTTDGGNRNNRGNNSVNRSGGSGGGSGGGGNRGNSGARDTINRALENYLPEPSTAEALASLRAFESMLNSLGLTAIYDVGRASDGPIELPGELAARGAATVRVFHTLRHGASNAGGVDRALRAIASAAPRQSNDWAGVIGLGEHLYGPLQDSALRATEFPAEYYSQFEKLATAAAKGGWHVHEHAMQDETIQGFLDAYERIAKNYSVERWTLAHCDYISEASIARAKRLGLTIAVHNKTAKPAGRGTDSPPLAAIEKSGIVWGLGSDGGVVAPINPFSTLWWAVTGKIYPDRQAIRSPVSREAALIAHTRSNAFLLFKEKDLGSLEVGKLADFVVLDRDYLTVPADEIRDIKPVATIVHGKIVYTARKD